MSAELGEPVPADASAIEQALDALWVDAEEDADAPIVRARALTLVAFVGSLDRLGEADRAVERAMLACPGRAVLLAAGEGSSGRLAAWITARCHPGLGGHVCGERIAVAASRKTTAALPALVAALRPPDVPTVLWWDAPAKGGTRLLARLADGVDRVIVDSAALDGKRSGLRQAARLARSRRHGGFADLSWQRLLPWRERIAQVFDAPAARPWLERLDRIDLSAAGPAGEAEAALMAGWLASRLGWSAGDDAGARWRRRDGGVVVLRRRAGRTERSGLLSVRLAAGESVEVAIESLDGGECAAVSVSLPAGRPRHATIALATGRPPGDLLVDALGAPGRDRVYEAALAVAAELSGEEHG